MNINQAILITVVVLLSTNLIGYIYTALILHTNLINDHRIQPKKYFAKRFYKRLPLILFNIIQDHMENTEFAKVYDPSLVEEKWYSVWEDAGAFSPKDSAFSLIICLI